MGIHLIFSGLRYKIKTLLPESSLYSKLSALIRKFDDVFFIFFHRPLRLRRKGRRVKYYFWAPLDELDGRYLRVVTLEDKITIHNAFLDRSFKQ